MTGKLKGHPYIWTEEYQKDFDDMKTIMIQDTLIVYPKYGEPSTSILTPVTTR